MKTSLIIVAAGMGIRLGKSKAIVRLAGKTLLEWNLQTALQLEFLDEIIIVISPNDRELVQNILPEFDGFLVNGGKNRSDSVLSGLEVSSGDIVIIHNVANPLASLDEFRILHEALLQKSIVAYVGQPVVDTLRRTDKKTSETIDRDFVWRVQTPQAFRRADLLQKLRTNANSTDEISLFENSSIPIKAFPCSSENFKITFPEDLEMAENIIRRDVLFGIGEDSHRFDTKGTLVLSGVSIKGFPKLQGNSDADVVLHAIFNAISSALGKGSIGPTADPMCKAGITNSVEYLNVILEEMKSRGYLISNLTISLECARPRIESQIPIFKTRLSEIFGLDELHMGITATSGEELTSFGKGEGIKCIVGVVLSRSLV